MSDYQPFFRSDPPSAIDREIFHQVMIEGRLATEVARRRGRDAKEIEKIVREVQRWLTTELTGQDPQMVKATHLKRLEHQWHEVADAWNASKKDLVTVKKTTAYDGKEKTELTRQSRVGNVHYLNLGRYILIEIRSLYGAEGALKLIEETYADVESLTPDERRTEVTRWSNLLRQRRRAEKDYRPDRRSDVDPESN